MGTGRILDEPVRGLVPPPWFHALSGVQRMRMWSDGTLASPPSTRLTGSRCTHIGPGSATCVMPATEMLATPNGQLEIAPLVGDALLSALQTAVGPGQIAQALTLSVNHFRPARYSTGNLVARARVLNASSRFAYAEASIEDNEGRQIASAGCQATTVDIDPAPPQAPAQITPVEQPTWATPDPWQRPPGANVPMSQWDAMDGHEIMQRLAKEGGGTPLMSLLGLTIDEIERDRIVISMPASEWFCVQARLVSPSIVMALANTASWWFGLSRLPAGETWAGLDISVRSFCDVKADGRPIRAAGRTLFASDDGRVVPEITITSADGQVVAVSHAFAVRIDSKRRGRPRRRASERALCTILFTDIVNSTAQAGALGDAAWQALLQQHDDIARRQVALAGGIVVKNTGDGLLVRFGSQARAIDCACRLRDALAGLGLQIRAGLHTGECEIMEDDIIGVAVNLAARVQAAANPGDILVSSTVKDLAQGVTHRFENRGEHTLKGFEEAWRLWAVI